MDAHARARSRAVVIAKMDATANDPPEGIDIQVLTCSYVGLLSAPCGRKDAVRMHAGQYFTSELC
jgi:hypothetical protein